MPRPAILAPALALALTVGAAVPACGSPAKPPVTSGNGGAKAAEAAAGPELRATVRIDAQPAAKRFQGVWLELGDSGARWVIDYRARDVWRPFADRAVLVTGRCYEPEGQAIGAQHFEVERMRFAGSGRPDAPILEVGPETRLRGMFAEITYPAGSKLAGSKDLVFRADDGAEFRLFGEVPGAEPGAALGKPALGKRVAIDARPVKRNLAYTAGPGGPHLWIADLLAASAGEREPGRSYGACPAPGGA